MNQPAVDTALAATLPEAPQPKRRKPSGSLECQIGMLIGLAGLAGSRLGQLWIAFDVFSQFTLQFAVIALAFTIGLFMPRAKLLAAFILIILGVIGIGVWPYLASKAGMALASPASNQRELKVASFNTFYENDDVNAVKAEILRLDADIITLVEMGSNKRSILGEVKDRYPYQAHCYQIDYCNLVILSKFPIVSSDAKSLWEGAPYIRARLGPDAGSITVFGVHTIRFPHSRAQFRQVNKLSQLIESTPGHKVVMGDFNATPFSRILQVVQARANLRRLTSLPSWPSHVGLPQISIDHIFVSPGIAATETERIGRSAGSDHFPVSMKIAVPIRP